MKICSKCKKEEVRADQYSYCRGCHNEYQKLYYHSNAKQKERIKENAKKYRLYVQSLKDNQPCKDCKVKYPYYVMHFDHLPKYKKEFEIATAVNFKFTKEKLIKELAKCELVCANCHAIRTHTRM